VSTLVLSRNDVAGLLDMGQVMDVVEQAFQDHAAGRTQMPPKVYIQLHRGDFRAMPGAVPGAAGVKWVNVHPGNRKLGLPTIMGIIICSDPDTAFSCREQPGHDCPVLVLRHRLNAVGEIWNQLYLKHVTYPIVPYQRTTSESDYGNVKRVPALFRKNTSPSS